MKKVLIAADEVDKWSRLCEGLQNEWECTNVNLDAFEKFHTIAVYDAVLMLVRRRMNEKLSEEKTGSFLLFPKQRLVKKAIVISESEKL